jgi:predicted amidohydrolase
MQKNKFVTIGLIQTKVFANKNKNLQKTATLVEKTASKGAQIICLQELYKTLYFPQYRKSKKEVAEPIPGESTKVFSALAKKHHVVIIVPIFEKTTDNEYYNSAAVINADGKLLDTYRKIHIPQDPYFYEQKHFKNSNLGYKVYKTKYAKFAVLICYDQWFPEAARIVTLKGADIIFYPTAIGNIIGHKTPEGDWHNAWETVMRGHAIANGIHIAAVNRVCKESKLKFWGQSFVCDAFGNILQRANSNKDEIIICQINLAQNKQVRDEWGFLNHRRPDTYQELC